MMEKDSKETFPSRFVISVKSDERENELHILGMEQKCSVWIKAMQVHTLCMFLHVLHLLVFSGALHSAKTRQWKALLFSQRREGGLSSAADRQHLWSLRNELRKRSCSQFATSNISSWMWKERRGHCSSDVRVISDIFYFSYHIQTLQEWRVSMSLH